MTFTQSVRTVFSNYVNFSGRATRPEFWWWTLFVFVLSLVLEVVDGVVIAPLLGFTVFAQEAGSPLGTIAALALLLPSLAVGVRRLHDIGRSGWWLLIILIPIIGFLVLIYWHIQPSEDGVNRFG
ncbi:DUF805 domain-containing protein [Hoeflea prorocentri]|uniref:DUF805 domain-containing protein n=1 Tax=Hoeflea prorocentri TaxID=1922333 RepID=A0A9X3ULX3_9HYPH|nr:DUF805 domain-containing protein [Hoeflea prorocentri]MCY6382820.1 DUF805 domain-containing protein [Hoeflea prorocentri]MDA5400620.1 DUF805 domain-containing protein [Hoeflea prorocentri]